jgi:hypothetical protein
MATDWASSTCRSFPNPHACIASHKGVHRHFYGAAGAQEGVALRLLYHLADASDALREPQTNGLTSATHSGPDNCSCCSCLFACRGVLRMRIASGASHACQLLHAPLGVWATAPSELMK